MATFGNVRGKGEKIEQEARMAKERKKEKRIFEEGSALILRPSPRLEWAGYVGE